MRFSIRHLLISIPIFLVVTALFPVFFFPLRSFPFASEINAIQFAQEHVEDSIRYAGYNEIEISNESIMQWLSGQLPDNHEAAPYLMDPPLDVWGQPYGIRFNEETGAPFVFSVGRDGKSLSNGNDADDIRSWDDDLGSWYVRQINRSDLITCMTWSALITPIILGIIVFIGKRWAVHSAG